MGGSDFRIEKPERHGDQSRRTGLIAWSLFGVEVTVAGAIIAFKVATGVQSGEIIATAGILAAFLAFPAVGAVIVSKQPHNLEGWVFCLLGLGISLGGSESYAHWALVSHPGAPLGVLAAWVAAWYWYPTLGLVPTLVLLLFPDGKPPSPRWNVVVGLAVAALAAITIAAALQDPLKASGYSINNPVVPGEIGHMTWIFIAASAFLGVVSLLCVASVVVRFRRSRGVERQQLKWFTFTAFCFALVVLLSVVLDLPDPIFMIMLAALPVSVGLAILRYRLYDIDRIISRTITYALSIGLLVASYFGIVLLASAVTPLRQGSPVVVALATLLLASVFRPFLSRMRTFVERRFNRSRYDATRTLEDFAGRLREQIDLESLAEELTAVAFMTMQPSAVALWLRPRAGME